MAGHPWQTNSISCHEGGHIWYGRGPALRQALVLVQMFEAPETKVAAADDAEDQSPFRMELTVLTELLQPWRLRFTQPPRHLRILVHFEHKQGGVYGQRKQTELRRLELGPGSEGTGQSDKALQSAWTSSVHPSSYLGLLHGDA
ncbi:hypothetical protein AK812_SmicGene39043 [Symbiodinium microadriaticum]|uniref:Uncharacterized protein n=1 Tax=Symbiodinium microadriaticum TaxID=2951 RepID=A0A1Q9CC78_SYMMI|nr:hypothetical protein AK812_SmicGene39043 [Symbiodinium microadriaticum]CAE7887589.1 unnamed protein product [Symbiodinium microadriaticum]